MYYNRKLQNYTNEVGEKAQSVKCLLCKYGCLDWDPQDSHEKNQKKKKTDPATCSLCWEGRNGNPEASLAK